MKKIKNFWIFRKAMEVSLKDIKELVDQSITYAVSGTKNWVDRRLEEIYANHPIAENPIYVVQKPREQKLAKVWMYAGAILAGIGAIVLCENLLSGIFGDFILIMATLAAGTFCLYRGYKNRERMQRYQSYRQVIGNQETISLASLAAQTGLTMKTVLSDVRSFLSGGLFRQGRLVEHEQVLLLTRHAQQEYVSGLDAKKKEARRTSSQLEEQRDYYLEALQQEVHRQDGGVKELLDHIRLSADAIFTAFLKGHDDPSKDRFLDYYLPTTLDLAHRYTVAQEHGRTEEAKDIFQGLEALAEAFVQLRRRLHQEEEMDLQSDLQVLRTILKQEGLDAPAFSEIDQEEKRIEP